jgi:integrase
MQTREQKGYVWKKGDWWWIRYADWIVEDGTLVRKQDLARKLAPVLPEHKRLTRPPEDVKEEQKRFVARINGSRNAPERNLDLKSFARNVWLPSIEHRHSASTIHCYRYYWSHVLEPPCGALSLRDFSTPVAQRFLDEIARQNPEMTKTTLHKLKSMLSAIFKLAIQQDYRLGPNPIRETSLPRARESGETVAYDLDTVLAMLRVVAEPSRTVMAVAAFAGLRRGEIEGLLWEAYDGDTLKVMRAMWKGIEGEPKSKKSKAGVPVISPLRKFLDQHRLRSGSPDTGIMFKTRNNTPLSMNNLLNDQIRPALDKCVRCRSSEDAHGTADHDYKRDSSLPEWHGFHAFRRGLATNLHDLGVDDLTIQRILRHGDVSTTRRCYIKTLPEQSVAAMRKLETMIDQASSICNESATEAGKIEVVH